MEPRHRINIKEELADPERREFLLKLACTRPEGHSWQDDPHEIVTPNECTHIKIIVGVILAVEIFVIGLILFTIFY